MAVGSGLPRLDGYPFEVRYSHGALRQAVAAADLAASGYAYLSRVLSAVEPDLALIVADETDWWSSLPYGLPFFNDDAGQIRAGIVMMPTGGGELWTSMAQDLHDASPDRYVELLTVYPGRDGGVDLQPFFDLIIIHELAHAFETFGDLRFPTFWLSEIFANLAMHAFVAAELPASLPTLEVLASVGAESHGLAARMRAEGYSTLDELQAHYTGGDDPMSGLNYVWYQYRWLRLAAKLFDADGEDGLRRLWDCFRATGRIDSGVAAAESLAPFLTAEVSRTLGEAIRGWR